MSYIKTIILIFLLYGFNPTHVTAQNTEHPKTLKKEALKDLKVAAKGDLKDKSIRLDGESIPIYHITGDRIKGMELMNELRSGKYTPDIYVNADKEIKVVVLRLRTEDEKKIPTVKKSGKSIAVGENAPDFSATDINGIEYSLPDLTGKIIVLNFWFVECKPCVMEIPELNELVKKYEGKDVVFLGFATNAVSSIHSFLEKTEFSYAIIPNSLNIADTYDVSSYPTHMVIDQSSKITFLTSGLGPTTIIDIEKEIEGLITE